MNTLDYTFRKTYSPAPWLQCRDRCRYTATLQVHLCIFPTIDIDTGFNENDFGSLYIYDYRTYNQEYPLSVSYMLFGVLPNRMHSLDYSHFRYKLNYRYPDEQFPILNLFTTQDKISGLNKKQPCRMFLNPFSTFHVLQFLEVSIIFFTPNK